ncbi:hypothetical protein [Streptomyces sp. NPDC007083]|uniref:hypothetical protein n=1 Tax=Streptomyces sp. NPDC007083 TaxID=3156913 RepID=UPI0033E2BF38
MTGGQDTPIGLLEVVAYGYASREDLRAARPDRLLDTPADLAAWCRAQATGPNPSLVDRTT